MASSRGPPMRPELAPTHKTGEKPQVARRRLRPCHKYAATGLFRLPGKQDAQHAPQWLRGAPQQLVAYSKRAEKLPPHFKLAQAPDRDVESPCDRSGRQLPHAGLAGIRDDAHPLVGTADDLFDLGQRQVAPELDRKRLAVATHGADPDTDGFDRNRGGFAAEDLVRLGAPLPFFLAQAVAHVVGDPGDQTTRERNPEMLG